MDRITPPLHNHLQYFEPPRGNRTLPIYCLDAGAITTPAGASYPVVPHDHPSLYRSVSTDGRQLNEYQVVYIASGEGWFETRNISRVNIYQATMLLLPPGAWHRYRADERTGWHEHWLGFTGHGAPALWRALALPEEASVLTLHDEDSAPLAMMREALRYSIHPTTADHARLAGIIHRLLACIAERWNDTRAVVHTTDERDRFEQVRYFLSQRIHSSVTIEEIERQVGCARSTLHRLFERYAGVSPYRYYLSLKVRAAAWELVHTNTPIKSIAQRYHFSDQYHFSRVFLSITGQRPSRWRATHHERITQLPTDVT